METEKKYENQRNIRIMFTVALLMSTPLAFAATDTLFTAIITKLTTILTGTGGIMLTLLSLLVAVISFLGHNDKTALGSLGVAVMASVGPTVANSFFTAVL